MRKLTKFSELKECYKDYDMAKGMDNTFILGDFLIKETGDVYFNRMGFTPDGEHVSISTYILRNKTIEQLEQFIQLVIGD